MATKVPKVTKVPMAIKVLMATKVQMATKDPTATKFLIFNLLFSTYLLSTTMTSHFYNLNIYWIRKKKKWQQKFQWLLNSSGTKSSNGNLVPVEPEGSIETKVPIDGTESLNGTKWNKMEQNVPNWTLAVLASYVPEYSEYSGI